MSAKKKRKKERKKKKKNTGKYSIFSNIMFPSAQYGQFFLKSLKQISFGNARSFPHLIVINPLG